MSLRCFVFSSDERTAALIRQMLTDLGVEAEACADAVVAAEKITNQAFQIVIIDWDKQPEAGVLLSTARERKASERPITLVIVSDDKSVPGALQAGANSILRKPIVLTQAKDTLTTARDLIRAKHESAAGLTHAASHPPAAPKPPVMATQPHAPENSLRAGELLPTFTVTPSGQFDTEPEKVASSEHSTANLIEPLKDLEPVAAAPKKNIQPVPQSGPEGSAPTTGQAENRGLEWYLKNRVSRPATPTPAPDATPQAAAPAPAATKSHENPELVGYEGLSSQPAKSSSVEPEARTTSGLTTLNIGARAPEPAPKSERQQQDEQQREAELFAYMDGERPAQPAEPRSRFGKKAIVGAVALAACAIFAAPQAPWHPQLRALWTGSRKTVHGWLNPQPVTTTPTVAAHEDFARPGDEYKLPVAEPIPDATTDPSQIQVVPAVDPTAKKPNDASATANQAPAQPDASASAAADPPSTSGTQTPDSQTPQVLPTQSQPSPAQTQPAQVQPAPTHPAPTATAPVQVATAKPTPVIPQSLTSHSPDPFKPTPTNPQLQTISSPAGVPSSLKSQMASMTPEASGNKAPETALPSIEPVSVSEAAERALISEQPAIAYPDIAKGQQGTVILQVLIGRDGVVQDAKFLQGSFVFARAAIDGVKPWKFKPYMMNGRPVQVLTSLTLKFKAGQ